MNGFFNKIYTGQIPLTILFLLLSAVVWFWLTSALKRYTQKAVLSSILLSIWLLSVLYLTIFSRTPGDYGVNPMPLNQLLTVIRGGNRELLRTFWMNVLLFAPLGFFLPSLLPPRLSCKARTALTAASACLLSLGIELSQWYFRLGEAETDDVIANTLGALLACALIYLCRKAMALLFK